MTPRKNDHKNSNNDDYDMDFDSYFDEIEKKLTLLSIFGFTEAYKAGALDVHRLNSSRMDGVRLMILWRATGPNPCAYCRSIDGMLFDVDEFPGPPHPHCVCNIPMANPVIIFD